MKWLLLLCVNKIPHWQKVFLVLVILFLLAPLMHHASPWRDTCLVTNTHVTPDVKSNGIMGVKIDFDSFLTYDTKHGKKPPYILVIEVLLLDGSGKPLPARGDASAFNRHGFASTENSDLVVSVGKTVARKFFIPYYCIDLPPGPAKLQFSVKVSVKDTAMQEKYRDINTKGITKLSFNITKPPVSKARFLCTGVRVTAKDHGRNWDFGLYGLPDPVFKVILDNGIMGDIIYASNVVNNSLSAAWIDPSPPFILSEGDQITIGIYDNDTLFDDLIGKEAHTLDEWLEITKSAKELAFGQVTYCTVKVEKMN